MDSASGIGRFPLKRFVRPGSRRTPGYRRGENCPSQRRFRPYIGLVARPPVVRQAGLPERNVGRRNIVRCCVAWWCGRRARANYRWAWQLALALGGASGAAGARDEFRSARQREPVWESTSMNGLRGARGEGDGLAEPSRLWKLRLLALPRRPQAERPFSAGLPAPQTYLPRNWCDDTPRHRWRESRQSLDRQDSWEPSGPTRAGVQRKFRTMGETTPTLSRSQSLPAPGRRRRP